MEQEAKSAPIPMAGVTIRSEVIADLAGALAKAQGEMAVPQKNRTAKVQMRAEKGGGTYEYKYADLSDIRAAVTPALAKNGLAISQPINSELCELTTLLLHSSGQYLGATYGLPTGLSTQAFGSALTYARRYSLCSLLGVVAEDDDDAGVAQTYTSRQARNAKTPQALRPKGTPPAANGTAGPTLEPAPIGRDEITKRIGEVYGALTTLDPNLDMSAEMYGRYGVQSRKDLRDDEAWDLLKWMEAKLKAGVRA